MRPRAEVKIDRSALAVLAEDALTGKKTARALYHPEENAAVRKTVLRFDEIDRMEAENA